MQDVTASLHRWREVQGIADNVVFLPGMVTRHLCKMIQNSLFFLLSFKTHDINLSCHLPRAACKLSLSRGQRRLRKATWGSLFGFLVFIMILPTQLVSYDDILLAQSFQSVKIRQQLLAPTFLPIN